MYAIRSYYGRVQHHVAGVDAFLLQYLAHETAEGVTTYLADHGGLATQTGDTDGHVGGGAAWTLQITIAAFRNEIHHCIAQHPHFVRHP